MNVEKFYQSEMSKASHAPHQDEAILDYKEIASVKFESLIESGIDNAEHTAEQLIINRQKHLDEIEVGASLSIGDIVSAREETQLFNRLEKNQRKMSLLLDLLKEKLFGLTTRDERARSMPIKVGEVFPPEVELSIIRKASKEKRPQLLREFKEKLSYQKEGLARIQGQIIQKIRENPDASLGQLYEWIRDWGTQYGLSFEQRDMARELLWKYVDKHDHVRSIYEQHPDSKELYRVLFGKEPQGTVDIIEGPMTLYVRCQNLLDYTRIYSQSFLRNRDITEHEAEVAKMSGGVSIGTSLISGLEGTIIAENAEDLEYTSEFLARTEKILAHEEQHAIKRLFDHKMRERDAWMRVEHAQTIEEMETAWRSFLRAEREEIADERARDEIFAFFKDGTSASGMLTYLTQAEEQGGLYDYLKGYKQNVDLYIKRNISKQFQSSAKKILSDMFGVEYQHLLRRGIKAVFALRKNGYNDNEVIATLIQYPLNQWEKVTKRLVIKQGRK